MHSGHLLYYHRYQLSTQRTLRGTYFDTAISDFKLKPIDAAS